MDDTQPFPIQAEHKRDGKWGQAPRCSIPWWLAEEAYKWYASCFGTDQSLQRLAERGGFGRAELLGLLRRSRPTMRRRLAAVVHEIWAHWMKYLFSCCIENDDGSVTIPADKVARWQRQQHQPFCLLSEKEKESDLHQAEKLLQALALEQ